MGGKVVIIKYNAGNTQSVLYALTRLGCEAVLSDDAQEIRSADKVLFPGVGEASTAMQYLHTHNLATLIPTLVQPVLGICLGLQLMCKHTEENDTDCLNIFDINVRKFKSGSLKVPQMGWNTLTDLKGELFKSVDENEYAYFVHSYCAELSAYTTATTEYSQLFSAALQKDNFYAVQFHPEKSAETGSAILQNFLALS